MPFFDKKLRDPVFLKTSSSLQRQLEDLQAVDRTVLTNELKGRLEHEIKLVEYGIKGESNIEFELRNSHMPMFVLHDLYLVHGDLSAQIDYLLITRRRSFVIECKNLYGNIEIDANGNFIKTTRVGNQNISEGIYSPDAQNRRHMELMKQLRRQEKHFFARALFEKYFYDNYRSVIVLANEKTILNDTNAPKDIKSQVVRTDALIRYIRQANDDKDAVDKPDKEMEALANFFLNAHVEREVDYAEKYRAEYIAAPQQAVKSASEQGGITLRQNDSDTVLCPKCGGGMVLRTAKKGKNIGKQFWGCSSFPKCKGNLPLEYAM